MTNVPTLGLSFLMCEMGGGGLDWQPRALLAILEICANWQGGCQLGV